MSFKFFQILKQIYTALYGKGGKVKFEGMLSKFQARSKSLWTLDQAELFSERNKNIDEDRYSKKKL